MKLPKIPKKLRQLVEYSLIRGIICMAQILSIENCAAIARQLAWLFNDVIKFRVDVVDENIRRVYSELTPAQRTDMAREMWYHLIMMGFDIIHAPRKIHDTNWRDYVYIRDKQLMTSYLIDYRPLIAGDWTLRQFRNRGIRDWLDGDAELQRCANP